MKTITLSLLLLGSAVLAFGQEAPHKFGWIGDSGQKRVMMMAPQQWPITTIAPQSDLSAGMPKVPQQGPIGSCVAHGTGGAWSFAHNLAGGGQFDISRLMTYYEARRTEGTTSWDSGCQIVDAVNWLQRGGSCKESLWPYDTSKFRIKPPAAAYAEGKKHTVLSARKVDNTDGKSIPLALTNGYPVVVGFLVYNEIYQITSSNYVLKMPKKGERPIGGHCTIIIGHDDAKQLYRVRNSWGPDWGNHGDFLIPYPYINSGRITEDCWVIVSVLTN